MMTARAWSLGERSQARRRMLPTVIVIVSYFGLSAIPYWSFWAAGGTRIAGKGGDLSTDAWFLEWVCYALVHLHNPLVTDWGNYPYGVNGVTNLSMPLLGVLGTPVTPVMKVAALTTIAAFIVSLGSRLTMGRYVWTAVPLPEAALTHIPILDNTIAARYSLYVMLGAAVMFALTIEALRERLLRERLHRDGRRPAQAAGAVCAALACLALLPLVPAWPYGARVVQVPRYFSSDLATAVPQGSVAVLYPFPASGDAIPMLWQVAADMRFKSPGGRFVIPAPGSVGTPASDRQTIVGQMFSQLAGGQLPALTPALRLALRAQLRSWDVRAVLVEATGQRPVLVLPFFEWLLGRPPDARSGGINAWYE